MRCLKSKRKAVVLARNIMASFKNKEWELKEERGLRFGDLELVLTPRRFRVFDRVQVLYKGIDIWIPLVPRLRLRCCVRGILACKANADFKK